MTTGVPPFVYVIFLIVPIVFMYWSSEAPKRPFSVIRTRENGEIIPVSERYQIKPNILLLTAHPDDEILFAPTILSLLTEERRGNSRRRMCSSNPGVAEYVSLPASTTRQRDVSLFLNCHVALPDDLYSTKKSTWNAEEFCWKWDKHGRSIFILPKIRVWQ